MGNRGIVIAIDGPAGSGKSTTARCVANRLGYLYLDTGAMYRALGWTLIRMGLSPDDAAAAAGTAAAVDFDFRLEDGGQRVLIDGEDVTGEIRSADVSDAASRVAVHPEVRKILVARQQELGLEGGIVLEGRDTGTAVFPQAELKIFLVADVAERARRRQRELLDGGVTTDLDELKGTDPRTRHARPGHPEAIGTLAGDRCNHGGYHRHEYQSAGNPCGGTCPRARNTGRMIHGSTMRTDIYTGRRGNNLYRFIWALGAGACSCMFRLRVAGCHFVPRSGGVILASNHASFADPVFIGVAACRGTFVCYQAGSISRSDSRVADSEAECTANRPVSWRPGCVAEYRRVSESRRRDVSFAGGDA